MLTRPLRFLLTIFACILLFAGILYLSQPASAAEAYIPTRLLEGAPVPDLDQITFSSLPVLEDAGTIALPSEVMDGLGWNPSRNWGAGTPVGEVLQLSDLTQVFGLERFDLNTIAHLTGLD